MHKNSMKIALGGAFSALCLLIMFLSGLVPFSQYAMPAAAGAMLIAVVIENGRKTALMVYVSVSVLSMLIVPDRESALMFVAFFGYYPIIKEMLERIKFRAAEYMAKLFVFNFALVSAYLILAMAFGIPVLDVGEEWGNYPAIALLAAGNAVFLLYDFALSRYVTLYVRRFRPRFLRR